MSSYEVEIVRIITIRNEKGDIVNILMNTLKIALGIFALILAGLYFFKEEFYSQFIYPVLTLIFLSTMVTELKESRKVTGIIYVFATLSAFILTISSFL